MSRLRLVAIIVGCAAACSSYGTKDDDVAPPPDRPDAGDDATSSDAGTSDVVTNVDADDAGGTDCDRTKPFGPPIMVPGLTSDNNEGSARLTADERQVFWSRYDGDWATWTASRASKNDPFGDAIKLAIVNDPIKADLDPSPTSDGLTLYFTSERDGGADIYRTKRSTISDPFGDPVRIDEASGSADDRRPFVTTDGTALWFDSSRTGASRIYRLGLSAIGIGAPELVDLGAVGDKIHDEHPVISKDGLALYFGARGRDDADTHVYMATRATTAAPFGTAVRVVAWPGYSAPSWITADDCRLYVSIGGVGQGTRIYMVQRAK